MDRIRKFTRCSGFVIYACFALGIGLATPPVARADINYGSLIADEGDAVYMQSLTYNESAYDGLIWALIGTRANFSGPNSYESKPWAAYGVWVDMWSYVGWMHFNAPDDGNHHVSGFHQWSGPGVTPGNATSEADEYIW